MIYTFQTNVNLFIYEDDVTIMRKKEEKIMMHKNLKEFPKDFLWRASTSAYQVEGANLEDGKGPSCQDVKAVSEGTSDLTVCEDHYH